MPAGTLRIRHSGQAKREPESRPLLLQRFAFPVRTVWIPAFARMTVTPNHLFSPEPISRFPQLVPPKSVGSYQSPLAATPHRRADAVSTVPSA